MDATPLSSKKVPPAADADALPSAAQQAVEPSSPSDAAATVKTSAGVRGGDDDDAQVERFYALLDNIRAMRGMLGTGATATASGRKRAREAEPPWRPAFRMEDFELEEVQSDAPCCDLKVAKRESSCCAGWPPAVRRETTDGGAEEQENGEVVEAKGRRRPQHKARRAGVLVVDGPGSR
ncbi:hypothetical protein SEVIR_3G275700v4 [Setaria viridis]|uniref:Uncharacterized protein n=1 Tax=Setaria viridis TaxID=4556 RepID=A0A4V6D9Y5_SETVI|nr:NRR repressor homolog 1-like [Setaria viridis]TKW27716.1 hypothetical protein SEVIR_3G275700v2 [Setaria viridis]